MAMLPRFCIFGIAISILISTIIVVAKYYLHNYATDVGIFYGLVHICTIASLFCIF